MKRLLILILGVIFLWCTPSFCEQWLNADTAFIDGDAVEFNDIDTNLTDYVIEPLDRMLAGYQKMALIYDSASQITVSNGEVIVSNSGGTIRLMMRNTSNTTLGWSDIDTGAEAGSTTYYIYAIAATTASETATFKISASSSAPSGSTYYKKLGSFYNDSSSDIDRTKIYTEPYGLLWANSDGKGLITDIRDYGTSASSYTAKNSWDLKVAFGSVSVAGASTTTISNLGFTSASSYACVASHTETGNLAKAACDQSSGSALIVRNEHADSRVIGWIAVGY